MLMVLERRRNGTDWFAEEIEGSLPGRHWEDAAQTVWGQGHSLCKLKVWWGGSGRGSEAGDEEFLK